MKTKLGMTMGMAAAFFLNAALSWGQSGVRYPYVENGKIIVSRDAAGGVNASGLLTQADKNALSTGNLYYTASACNKPSAKFEVYATDVSTEQKPWYELSGRKMYNLTDSPSGTGADKSICPAGWRMPTQRELQLIWIFKRQLTGVTPLKEGDSYSRSYGCGTLAVKPPSGGEYNFWTISLGTNEDGYMSSRGVTTGSFLRCVRDVE